MCTQAAHDIDLTRIFSRLDFPAQGRPSDWHHLYAAVRSPLRYLSRSGPRVRGQHPAFPAPSWLRGQRDQAKLGRNALRGCIGVSAALSSPGLDRAIQYSRNDDAEPGRISPHCSVLLSGSRLCAAAPRGFAAQPGDRRKPACFKKRYHSETLRKRRRSHPRETCAFHHVANSRLISGSPCARGRDAPRSSGGRGCARSWCRGARSPPGKPGRGTAGT